MLGVTTFLFLVVTGAGAGAGANLFFVTGFFDEPGAEVEAGSITLTFSPIFSSLWFVAGTHLIFT